MTGTQPTREQIISAITCGNTNSVCDFEVEIADRVLALFPQPNSSGECTCGYGGVHEPMNPRCEQNGYRWTEPPSIADMAPGTTFTSDGVMFMRCAVDIVGRPGDVVNTVGWFYNSGYFDPSTIRDITPPKVTS